MSNYGIDTHKLAWHPRRVADWLDGKLIFPLYVEIGATALCCHRCIFCAFDYTKYKGAILNETSCEIFLKQSAQMGLKSVMFAGEGEPLMNPDIVKMISYAKKYNVDVSITTNGIKLDEGASSNILPLLDWIRFSVDAATPDTYAEIHGCSPKQFDKLIKNITMAVRIKRERHLQCTIGVQSLLIPQNEAEVVSLCQLAQNWGVDYFTVKPFSKHPSSICNFEMDYSQFSKLNQELQEMASDEYQVIFRSNATKKIGKKRYYKECLALPFATYLSADGYIYPCSMFLGQLDYTYGNIYEQDFISIWEGGNRQVVMRKINEVGVENCREACRWDEVNRYLWQLKYELPQHVNFI